MSKVLQFQGLCNFRSFHGSGEVISAAITSSVQLTGVFVVFASLIAPALGAARFAGSRRELPTAYGIALIGLLSGFGVAIGYDLPLGPVLVCSFMLSALFAGVWPFKRTIFDSIY